MDLRSDFPYWLLRKGIINSFPSLSRNERADIAIIGGGISGALTAWELINAGHEVVLVDRRHIGMGSTAASTSLLQYEIDVPLFKLSQMIGEQKAARSYLLCRDAISKIENIAMRLRTPDLVVPRPSFQFASHKKDDINLRNEFELRQKYGFDIDWLNREQIESTFGFSKSAGVLSAAGAVADAYGLTHAILAACARRGLRIYDHTEVRTIQHRKRSVVLTTADGMQISARKLVIACGYESQQYLPVKIQTIHSTFAIVSERQPQKEFWHRNAMIWETQLPYLYLRTTDDGRVIIGGKDIPSASARRRDSLLGAKSEALRTSFVRLFPSIPFKIDFRWAGSFASTKDGLPYIGAIRQRPHTYFALGFGGNGITFSMIAAEIIRDLAASKKNNDAELFAFDR